LNRLQYLLLIPAVTVALVVGAYPILFSIILSLSEFSITTPEIQVVGVQNYISVLFGELAPVFWNSAGVTLLIVVGAVAVELVVGIILGLALFGNFRARSLFYSILVVPLAVAPIVLGILSSPNVIWDDINTLLFYGTGLGISIDLFQPAAFYSVIILADAWLWSPLIMLVTLAILQGIPKEHFEAAEIHGASSWMTFRSVIFPSIIKSPVLGFVLTLRVIDAFKSFEIPFAWTFWLGQNDLGSPVDTFSVLMWKLLTSSVYDFPLAAIATIALISTAIILVFAVFALRYTARVYSD